jgi:hypothetical protein
MDIIAVKKLAEYLGFPELRAGRQTLRDARGWREGEIHIASLWYAAIRPTFHDDAILCCATTKETEFRGRRNEAWCRAGLLLPNTGAVAWTPIKDDPLRPEVASLDIMARSGTLSLDGIGYEIHFASGDLQCQLEFCNPVLPALVSIERALYQIGHIVAGETQDAEALAYMEIWRPYLGKRIE